MKRAVLGGALALVLAVGLYAGLSRMHATWQGVDEAVVERYAAAAGRPARPPLLDPGQGDLLLFLFLIAGTAGGFVAGYFFRALFPPKGGPGAASR